MFPVEVVPDDAGELTEQLGTKPKFWFADRRKLFKEARPGTGEDWAEKVASELCALLGLPHAEYDLAVWRDRRGVVTPSFVPPGGRLVLGNELLAHLVPEYPRAEYRVQQHVLDLVLRIVASGERIGPPLGVSSDGALRVAADYFVGYLMLDVWIGNQDRNHQNWGLVVQDGRVHLAPTFDHASSLGRNESDTTRNERLKTTDVGRGMVRYVDKARSKFFETDSDQRPMTTLAAFRRAAGTSRAAARLWLDRLRDVGGEVLDDVFRRIPSERISPAAVAFARTMLDLNRERLLGSNP